MCLYSFFWPSCLLIVFACPLLLPSSLAILTILSSVDHEPGRAFLLGGNTMETSRCSWDDLWHRKFYYWRVLRDGKCVSQIFQRGVIRYFAYCFPW
ncbi:hypothetical protein BDV38DRAFT_262682 [Aspergillus pseudotamarii]|uniref:Secreted protein n=1 Tax=Aspergillus pseudotamarii TaxID=132259 RepID=A0A5N6SE32_ASPPS|nr:uncharacterized protein BDV38DRAFT_262682 [Aspergillus pseudotamarii]KAE8131970.1 hypothetical protein BDV38DRAFT_262682 [Aspergillus pseudotamarii]